MKRIIKTGIKTERNEQVFNSVYKAEKKYYTLVTLSIPLIFLSLSISFLSIV